MAEASIFLAGNLTDDPEQRYTHQRGRQGDLPGGRVQSRP
jgi:single-stranded DNA-binding protein